MTIRTLLLTVPFICFLVFSGASAQQMVDPHFDSGVDLPAFTKNFPRVLFDEAHNNSETSKGRYKPFADLLFNDGYHLVVNRQPFTKEILASFKILVIVNPLGAEEVDDEGADGAAFTAAECDAVADWIRSGGALLLAVDAGPFASAAEILAQRLGIEQGKSETKDAANADKELNDASVLVYTRANQLLVEHSIANGRSDAERLKRVLVFGGQSLKGPEGNSVFLKLADTAVDKIASSAKGVSANGRGQGLAFRLGKGRVVAVGDAAMLSAQLSGSDKQPIGMNVPNVDNRQLALNIMHWLSGLLK
jgi:hypothetical protein